MKSNEEIIEMLRGDRPSPEAVRILAKMQGSDAEGLRVMAFIVALNSVAKIANGDYEGIAPAKKIAELTMNAIDMLADMAHNVMCESALDDFLEHVEPVGTA